MRAPNCLVQAYLVSGTALVRTEHNDVWRCVGKLFGVEGLIILEKLHVSSTALETICNKSVSHVSRRVAIILL
jgi:hypothetical protein